MPWARLREPICEDCGIDISHRKKNARTCKPCGYNRILQTQRNYNKKRTPRIYIKNINPGAI